MTIPNLSTIFYLTLMKIVEKKLTIHEVLGIISKNYNSNMTKGIAQQTQQGMDNGVCRRNEDFCNK